MGADAGHLPAERWTVAAAAGREGGQEGWREGGGARRDSFVRIVMSDGGQTPDDSHVTFLSSARLRSRRHLKSMAGDVNSPLPILGKPNRGRGLPPSPPPPPHLLQSQLFSPISSVRFYIYYFFVHVCVFCDKDGVDAPPPPPPPPPPSSSFSSSSYSSPLLGLTAGLMEA